MSAPALQGAALLRCWYSGFDSLHGARAYAVLGRYLQDAFVAALQGCADGLLLPRIYRWAAKALAFLARSAKPCVDAADDHGALEFSEDAKHLKHRAPCWSTRIEPLNVQVQIDARSVYLAEEADQVLKGSPETVNAPSGDHVDLTPRCGLQHPIEAGPLVAALRPTDPRVAELCDHGPAVTLCHGAQLLKLVVNALSVSANPRVDRNPLAPAHYNPPSLLGRIIGASYAIINRFRHKERAWVKSKISAASGPAFQRGFLHRAASAHSAPLRPRGGLI